MRRIGDMVGRRREQRLILRALRDADGAGVLLHGIGGVGKSTLAAQILHRLADDDGFLLISLKGETDPDRILAAVGACLFSISLAQGEDEKAPLRQLANVLREPKYPWRDRFEVLAQRLLAQVPVAFLFDNFEDNLPKENLKDGAPAEELAALLARWLQTPLQSRLVFTCRYPFALPDDAHDRLEAFHLGPLSWAETRKLFWRLDGLKALLPEEQRRAYENVGGHPRALEYLDAILRGGKARFPDVQSRLRKQLKDKGITEPARWCADTGGGLDAALAETVTLAADDVLLDQLLAQLADDPLCRRMLIGASVYRLPVDELGLIWTVGEPVEFSPDPARTARLQAIEDRLDEARTQNQTADLAGIFSEAELYQSRRDFAEEKRPPVEAPAGCVAAIRRLFDLSLLAPVRFADDDEEKFLVHRWTAGALAKRTSDDEQTAAHRAAAAYWRWRVAKRPQSREQDIEDLLEARYHLHALGDLAEVHSVSGTIILQLDTWGAWEWEERLLRETLAWMPEGSTEAAACLHHLGMVAQGKGDYDGALEWYRKSLVIKEQLGDRADMARSYHQLGIVAQLKGDYDAALDWYRKSLAISEQLGDRAGMARSLSQIGVLYTQTGRAAVAVPLNLRSLALRREIRSPDIRINLHWLSRQQQVLGTEAFRDIVAEHCEVESRTQVLALVETSIGGRLTTEQTPGIRA